MVPRWRFSGKFRNRWHSCHACRWGRASRGFNHVDDETQVHDIGGKLRSRWAEHRIPAGAGNTPVLE